jgi:UDP-glucose 4-epimerase
VAAPEAYRGARALVIGGLGFIGSHLAARLLELDAEVRILDSAIPGGGANEHNVRAIAERVQIIRGDLRDAERTDAALKDCDVVFNLAGQTSHVGSMQDPQADLDLNCRAQLAFLEVCRRSSPDARVVYAGSRQPYGEPLFLPVTEEHPLRAVDVNGIHLAAAEAYHLLYHRAYGLPTVSLRLTNIYGPHVSLRGSGGFVAAFVRRALEGEPISVFGDGAQVRDYVYVSDAVDAFLAAGADEAVVGEAMNVGGTERASILELAELCQRLAGSNAAVRLEPWPEDQRRIALGSIYLDSSRFSRATGWEATVSLADGLRRTIDFYREHFSHYVP